MARMRPALKVHVVSWAVEPEGVERWKHRQASSRANPIKQMGPKGAEAPRAVRPFSIRGCCIFEFTTMFRSSDCGDYLNRSDCCNLRNFIIFTVSFYRSRIFKLSLMFPTANQSPSKLRSFQLGGRSNMSSHKQRGEEGGSYEPYRHHDDTEPMVASAPKQYYLSSSRRDKPSKLLLSFQSAALLVSLAVLGAQVFAVEPGERLKITECFGRTASDSKHGAR